MATNWRNWRHVVKLDPDKTLTDAELAFVCTSGTDAIIIGGTQGITFNKVHNLLHRVKEFPVPVYIEVSSKEAIVPGAMGYFVPIILNTTDVNWIIGAHQRVVKEIGELVDWSGIIPVGYIVLNPNSAVAEYAAAWSPLLDQDVMAFAKCGEGLFRLPIIYMEYSGKFGDSETVGKVKNTLNRSRLFYGGGIDSPEKAVKMSTVADTIVVGNMIYEGKIALLPETVRIAKKG